MHVTKILERPQASVEQQPKRNSGIAETFDVNSTDDSKLAASSKNAWGKPAVQAQPQPQPQQQQQQQNASWASIMNTNTTANNNSSPVAEVKGKASAGPFKISFSEIVRSSNSGAPLVAAPTPSVAAAAAALPAVAPANLTPPSTNATPVKASAHIANGTKASQPMVQPAPITPSRKQMNEAKSLNSAVLNGVKPAPSASSIAKVAPIISAPVAPANAIAANQVSGPKQVFSKTNKMNKSDDANRIGYENVIFFYSFLFEFRGREFYFLSGFSVNEMKLFCFIY